MTTIKKVLIKYIKMKPDDFAEWIGHNAEELLQMEKEEIVNAFNRGQKEECRGKSWQRVNYITR
jgi:hypothetical protein